MIPIIGGIVEAGLKIIDKVIPDPAQAAEAKLNLLKLQQEGALEEVRVSLSAIIAEAQSEDSYTSRARPSFLYVIYILLLSALPFSILYANDPALAGEIVKGFHAWLDAIPEQYVTLFGIGYLGYTGARSFDKRIK